MSALTIRHKDEFSLLPMPYIIAINGRNVGIMRKNEVRIDGMPQGLFEVTVKCGAMFKGKELMVSGTTTVDMNDEKDVTVEFCSHERVWNILFDIDLILWIVEFFVAMSEPWNFVYKIASDGFFLIWMLRVWIIRKRYYSLNRVDDASAG